MNEEYLTVDELCELLKFKRSYVYHLTHHGLIPHLKLGNHLRFPKTKVLDWLDTHLHIPPSQTLVLTEEGVGYGRPKAR